MINIKKTLSTMAVASAVIYMSPSFAEPPSYSLELPAGVEISNFSLGQKFPASGGAMSQFGISRWEITSEAQGSVVSGINAASEKTYQFIVSNDGKTVTVTQPFSGRYDLNAEGRTVEQNYETDQLLELVDGDHALALAEFQTEDSPTSELEKDGETLSLADGGIINPSNIGPGDTIPNWNERNIPNWDVKQGHALASIQHLETGSDISLMEGPAKHIIDRHSAEASSSFVSKFNDIHASDTVDTVGGELEYIWRSAINIVWSEAYTRFGQLRQNVFITTPFQIGRSHVGNPVSVTKVVVQFTSLVGAVAYTVVTMFPYGGG